MQWVIDSLRPTLLDPVSPILDPEPSNSFDVVLYPNPAKEILTAEIRGPYAAEKQYTLFDSTGRIMWKRNGDLSSIEKDVFEVGDLSKGIYWLKVEFEEQVELQRFVKL